MVRYARFRGSIRRISTDSGFELSVENVSARYPRGEREERGRRLIECVACAGGVGTRGGRGRVDDSRVDENQRFAIMSHDAGLAPSPTRSCPSLALEGSSPLTPSRAEGGIRNEGRLFERLSAVSPHGSLALRARVENSRTNTYSRRTMTA